MSAAFTFARIAVSFTIIVTTPSMGAPPSFKISEVFSTVSGNLQLIRLTETEGRNGQRQFAGLKLKTTHNGVTKEYTFQHDLDTDQTAYRSIVIATTTANVPIVVQQTAYNEHTSDCWCYVPDFGSMDLRFVSTDGGVIDFAGVDEFRYSSLPVDGLSALRRDGSIKRATVPGNGRCYAVVGCRDEFDVALIGVYALAFYNAALDHYFVSASAPDIDALDSGRSTGWQRTGEFFQVGATPNSYPGLSDAVCRFYIPIELGDSHFYSASAAECADVERKFPRLIKETDAAFFVALPDASGVCPPDLSTYSCSLVPVYRLWNQRADSNHRYTPDKRVRDAMLQQGYVSEGYGDDGVAFCTPNQSPWDCY